MVTNGKWLNDTYSLPPSHTPNLAPNNGIARAENKIENMLFIGVDFNNRGFTSWKRID